MGKPNIEVYGPETDLPDEGEIVVVDRDNVIHLVDCGCFGGYLDDLHKDIRFWTPSKNLAALMWAKVSNLVGWQQDLEEGQ